MFIGDILVSQGLVTRADVAAALERQKSRAACSARTWSPSASCDPADLEGGHAGGADLAAHHGGDRLALPIC